jgi:hypothetical protein
MALILPRSKSKETLETLQLLSQGVDKFLGAKRQKKFDDAKIKADAEAAELRTLQAEGAQLDVAAKRRQGARDLAAADVLKKIGEAESINRQSLKERTDPEFVGPPQPEVSQETMDDLIATYGRAKGVPQTRGTVKTEREQKALALGIRSEGLDIRKQEVKRRKEQGEKKIEQADERIALRRKSEARQNLKLRHSLNENEENRLATLESRFLKDKVVDTSRQALSRIDLARELIESGNKIAPPVAKRQLARIAGEVGVLTDQDVAAFGGSAAIDDKISRWFSSQATGDFSETDREEMLKLIDVMSERHSEIMAKQAESFSRRTASLVDIPADEISSWLLTGEQLTINPTLSRGIERPAAQPTQDDESAINNELLKLLSQ